MPPHTWENYSFNHHIVSSCFPINVILLEGSSDDFSARRGSRGETSPYSLSLCSIEFRRFSSYWAFCFSSELGIAKSARRSSRPPNSFLGSAKDSGPAFLLLSLRWISSSPVKFNRVWLGIARDWCFGLLERLGDEPHNWHSYTETFRSTNKF